MVPQGDAQLYSLCIQVNCGKRVNLLILDQIGNYPDGSTPPAIGFQSDLYTGQQYL